MKALYLIHIAYLCSLPILASVAIISRDFDSPFLRFAGWIPAVVFAAILISQYSLTTRPFKAMLVVLLMPLQALLITLHLGGDIWLFFLDAAFYELAGLTFALAITMMIYRPTGWHGAVVGLLLALIVVVAYGLPLIQWKRTAGGDLWWIPLLFGLVTGVWAHVQQLMPRAIAYLAEQQSAQKELPGLLFDAQEQFVSPLEKYATHAIVAVLVVWLVLFLTPLLSLAFPESGS